MDWSDLPVGGRYLIDSNVVLDVIDHESEWTGWSDATLAQCLRTGVCHINTIVYAEVSYGYDELEALDVVLPSSLYRRAEMPYTAAFLAAKAHHAYRRRGGTRVATLPDFFIGAHALVEGMTLVTRDPRRYLQAFPGIRLVSPE